MLNINQNIYTVCARWNNEEGSRKYDFYISEKSVKTVHINDKGQLVYIAGDFYELPFTEMKKGVYKSLSKPFKYIHLNKEDAEKEMSKRITMAANKADEENKGNDGE